MPKTAKKAPVPASSVDDPYALPKGVKVPKGKQPALLGTFLEGAEEEEDAALAAATRAEGTDQFQELVALAEEAVAEKDTVDQLEAQVKEHKARYDELRKVIIPEKMQKLGIVKSNGKGSFTFSGGKIHLETKVMAGCTEAMRPKFHAWLKANNAADLIKEAVNVQTLSAYVRERRGEGLPDPPFISVHEETVAKLTKG